MVAAKALPARIGPAVTPDTVSLSGAAMKLSLPVITSPASPVPALPL